MPEPLVQLRSVAVPLDIAKIDTGMMVPVRYQRLRRLPGDPVNATVLLHDLRFDHAGRPRSGCVLNAPVYAGARILVAGPDFGCGSSRESAAYAVLDYGFRVLVAESFGDVFFANCLQNGVLPVVLPGAAVRSLMAQLLAAPGTELAVDLREQTVTAPDGTRHEFAIDPVRKERLLLGLDDVGVTLQHRAAIEAFEARHRARWAWLPAVGD